MTRWLQDRGYQVIEVNRPNRQVRRRRGKSDPVDAEAAARAVLAGQATVAAKTADGAVEMLRVLRVARRSAVKAHTQAANQLASLVVTAPELLRQQLRPLGPGQLVRTAAGLRPGPLATPTAAAKLALRELARRAQCLSAEIRRLDAELARLTRTAAPGLLARRGVGAEVAGALLVVAGDNPQRLRSEAAFSMLCGASPLPASSGRTVRHRLNRGGDRQANNALWRIVLVRMSCDARTRSYVARRTAEGKSKREIIRCFIGRVSAAVIRSPGSWLLGRRQGTASLLCRQTASFSSAAPGAPRPCRPASGTRPVEGRTMKNRRQGPQSTCGATPHSRGRPDVRRLGLGEHHP